MKNSLTYALLLLGSLILFLQGCGNSDGSKNYPTTLGESASITTSDKDAVMLPNINIIKAISQEISTALTSDINTLNRKEAIAFRKETNYCDVTGIKESDKSGNINNINNIQSYKHCQEQKSLQDGQINIHYSKLNEEGKYPKKLSLIIDEDYSFNNIILKKSLTIESDIVYKADKSIQKITLKIEGTVNFNNLNYALHDVNEVIRY